MQDLEHSSFSTSNDEDLLKDIHKPPEVVVRHGRPYIRDFFQAEYLRPVDHAERLRQEEEHTSLISLFGDLRLAPCDPNTVLAIGSVYGYWPINFAESYPSSKVYSFDSVNLPPKTALENIIFHDDHINRDKYKNIEFAHVSQMGHRVKNLDDLLEWIARCCKCGAWVKFVDWVIQGDADCAVSRWYKAIKAALHQYKYDIDLPIEYEDKMKEEGFCNITIKEHRIPMSMKNGAHTEASRQVLQQWLDGIEAFSLEPITAKLPYIAEQVRELCHLVRQEIMEDDIDIHLNWRVIYGQTPLHPQKDLTLGGPDRKKPLSNGTPAPRERSKDQVDVVLDPLSLFKTIVDSFESVQTIAFLMECITKLPGAADDGCSGNPVLEGSHCQLDIERAAKRKAEDNSTNFTNLARESKRCKSAQHRVILATDKM